MIKRQGTKAVALVLALAATGAGCGSSKQAASTSAAATTAATATTAAGSASTSVAAGTTATRHIGRGKKRLDDPIDVSTGEVWIGITPALLLLFRALDRTYDICEKGFRQECVVIVALEHVVENCFHLLRALTN